MFYGLFSSHAASARSNKPANIAAIAPSAPSRSFPSGVVLYSRLPDDRQFASLCCWNILNYFYAFDMLFLHIKHTYRKIPKISPFMYKPPKLVTQKNPPLNRPSEYKPPATTTATNKSEGRLCKKRISSHRDEYKWKSYIQTLTSGSLRCTTKLGRNRYRKIPKISPRAYIFQRPFLRGLYSEGLI